MLAPLPCVEQQVLCGELVAQCCLLPVSEFQRHGDGRVVCTSGGLFRLLPFHGLDRRFFGLQDETTMQAVVAVLYGELTQLGLGLLQHLEVLLLGRVAISPGSHDSLRKEACGHHNVQGVAAFIEVKATQFFQHVVLEKVCGHGHANPDPTDNIVSIVSILGLLLGECYDFFPIDCAATRQLSQHSNELSVEVTECLHLVKLHLLGHLFASAEEELQ
mmetsp:Transcript_12244/g.35507  ORF Transcript_12244/g.35507 Transcript_12244/m.35507 type:complete len:217 (+) Transcript_12244:1125-1775(+)